MKFLLDTNIVVDVISRRGGFEDSLTIFRSCEVGIAEGVISATTVTDVRYILRKHIDPGGVRDAVKTLLLIMDVAGVLKSDISAALLSEVKDFEDAVQASCAERIKADYIVTHNLQDFGKSSVPAISPSKALELIGV